MALIELQQELYSVFSVNGSVMALQQSNSVLLCVDSSYYINTYNLETSVLENSFQVSRDAESPHRHSNGFSASSQGLLCIPVIGTKKALIITFVDGAFRKRGIVKEHDGDIEASAFSRDGHYYATGGQDGRVFIYDVHKFSVISSLIPRADYISVLRFSNNSELLAAGGFDKTVVVFDLVQNRTRCTIKTIDVVERADFCDNDQKLYMIMRNGGSLLYDIVKKEIVSVNNIFSVWPSALAVSPDQRFAVVAVRGDLFYIVNLKNNTRMIEFRMNVPGVNKIAFADELLFVGATDGTIFCIEHKKGEEELEQAVKNKQYQTARDMIENNLFLSIHPLMKVFDDDWPIVLNQARELLNKEKTEEAVALVKPFLYDEDKTQEFNFYLMQQDKVRAFTNCVKEKEYIRAYEMTLITKFLVNTSAYRELEQAWNIAFSQAKKILEENPTLNVRKAEMVMKPFESSVKKELISQLLKNSHIFVQADNVIKQKNFKAYFTLVNQYSFLRDTDLYKKVALLGDRNMAELLRLEDERKYDRAESIAKFLQVFPNFKRAATEHLIIIQQKQHLLTAIETDNIVRVYAIIHEYASLRTMPEFRVFARKFEEVFKKAEDAALAGFPKTVIATFGTYMEVPYWIDRIASLLKIAYVREIEKKIPVGGINWPVTLKRFVERFGKDDLLKIVMEENGLGEEFEAYPEEGSFIGYRNYKFVDGIVIFIVEREPTE